MKSGGDGIKKIDGNGPAQPPSEQSQDGPSKAEPRDAGGPSMPTDEYVGPAGNDLPRIVEGKAPAAVATHHPNLPDDLRAALSSPKNRELIVSELKKGQKSEPILYLVGLAPEGTDLPSRLIIGGGEKASDAKNAITTKLRTAGFSEESAYSTVNSTVEYFVFLPAELLSYVVTPEIRKAILDGAKQDTDEAAELSWKSRGETEILDQIMARLWSGARESRAKYYVAAGVIHRDLPLILGEGRTARKAQDNALIELRKIGFSNDEADILFRYYFYKYSSDDLDSDLEFLPESESDIRIEGETLTILPGSDRYFPDGQPKSATLAVAQTVQGVPCNEGTVLFHNNGWLAFATLARGYRAKGGVQCAAGENILFHPNGEVMFAVLGGGTPHLINGVTFRPGTTVAFDKNGRLRTAYHVKASTQGIDYEDGTGEPGSTDVLFDEDGKVNKPGPSGGKTPASANEGSAPPAPLAGGENLGAASATSSSSPASFSGLVFVTATATEAAADTSDATGADDTYTWDPMSLMSDQGTSTLDAASVGTDLSFQPWMPPAQAGTVLVGQ